MSKFSKILIFATLILCLAVSAILLSCGDNGTDSKAAFEPGKYMGTYTIVEIIGSVVQTTRDTMTFEFTKGGAFYMRLDTTIAKGQSRDYCDVTGRYVATSGKIDITIDYIYPQTCDHSKIPEDDYQYYGRQDELVLNGAKGDYDREIILWLDYTFEE